MTARPLVSVLMPTWRTPVEFVRQAIESVLQQEYDNLELMIVEDPSDQQATDLVQSFNDERIRYHLNGIRTSLVAQRNLALEMSRGDLIAKADADDIYASDRLMKQVQEFEKRPELDVLGGQIEIIDANGNTIGQRHYPLTHKEILRLYPIQNPFAHPTVCFRRELYEQHGGYLAEFPVAHDYAFLSMLARRGATLGNLPDVLTQYRLHPYSIKSTRLKDTIRATLNVKRKYWSQQIRSTARMRYWAENLMLYAPASAVYYSFQLLEYQRQKKMVHQ
ncbi:glycosyltransferase [Calycomorphotria hydatis]|nr:glycosyltransferase [Calycomorphotria hydatis]